ncbi:MAG: glycosyltransferase family 2 protein [Gammaproteobacteria bacterium]|nr:MAG: glycosyltransferase family 2 protein [Gammaproteobacteria bacterium]
METLRFAIVIPALNEAGTIRKLAEACLQQADTVIVVDDGSDDGTAGQLAGLPLELVHHEVPRGKGAALWAGLNRAREAGATHAVTLDGDGQHDPADIPRLLAAARANPRALVIGSRRAAAAAMPAGRRRANRIADFFMHWAGGQPVPDSQSGFRVYPLALLDHLHDPGRFRGGFVFESWAVIRAGRHGVPVTGVEIPAIYHAGLRPSHFRPWADITAITLMTTLEIVQQGFALRALWQAIRALGQNGSDGSEARVAGPSGGDGRGS